MVHRNSLKATYNFIAKRFIEAVYHRYASLRLNVYPLWRDKLNLSFKILCDD